ncbi:hypothetical protein HYY74_02815 [Candidatus Woesearchaeota archaeon]|nr:hypothetical protein [Candidatus Woesearchaeota archaeon]
MEDRLIFSVVQSSVNAYLADKAYAMDLLAKRLGPDAKFAYYGDGPNDISAMLHERTALAACPSDADPVVKIAIDSMGRTGFVAGSPLLSGFLEAYALAASRGIRYFATDRDDSIVSKGDFSNGSEFYEMARRMGEGCSRHGKEVWPLVYIITGGSVQQNLEMLSGFGLDRLGCNRFVRRDPYLVLAENGLRQINVLTGQVAECTGGIDPLLIGKMPEFQRTVRQLVEPVLKKYGFVWANSSKKGDREVGWPEKRYGCSVDLPRTVDGLPYRRTESAWPFIKDTLDAMVLASEQLGLKFGVFPL